jgi:hypothetical protein
LFTNEMRIEQGGNTKCLTPDANYGMFRAMERRQTLLLEADGVVEGNRSDEYPTPLVAFTRIAKKWEVTLSAHFGIDVEVPPLLVALLMEDLKTCRLAHNLRHRDSWLDLAGYAGCADSILNETKHE